MCGYTMGKCAFFVVPSKVWTAFALRDRENSGKHVTLGLRDVQGAVFSRSDCDSGRGGARGASRRRRGPPGATRRLLEDSILIRTVKYVVSEAQVRQNVVNLRISEGVPGGPPGDLFVVSSRVWAAFALRDRENSGKHVTLGLRDVRTAIRQLLDSY